MSDHYLRYVPTAPTFQPPPEAANAARQRLHGYFPQAQAITATFHEHVTFVDPASNWSGVCCPRCNTDLEAWWGEAMDDAYTTHFEHLEMITPCCHTTVSLNDLRYRWPAAFGRFVLEAENPQSRGLTVLQLVELEDTLGCGLREIAAHG